MKLYPLCLCGVTKSPIWGGRKLLDDWGKAAEAETVGESWELTVRKNEKCKVLNGDLAGKTLDEVIDAFGRDVTGGDFGSSDFPILIKLIDANDRLSVQVHPDDSYASRVENDRGKTEMWYIVDADEGAELICGLADGVTSEDFARAVREGKIESVLKHQPVRKGECYFIPAGLAHAIGKGILIAEIQQNCDLTYRVYDYERRDAAGNLRELHVEKALDVIRPFSETEINAVRYARTGGTAPSENVLAHCDFFRVEQMTLAGAPESLRTGVMQHLLCLDGEATLLCEGERYCVKRGESWLIPASLSGATLTGDATLILSSVD